MEELAMNISTVRKRTQEDVVEYIKSHAQDGKLSESLMDIAERLGYSNATIHRVLKSLEKQGLVRIIPSGVPTKPNTIVFQGEIDKTHDVIKEGHRLVHLLEQVVLEAQEYVKETSKMIAKLQEKHGDQDFDFIRDKVVDIMELPDGDHYIMMVKKSSNNEVMELREKFFPEEAQ
jgi:predicted ArsR family transcriptional regulator